MSVALINKMRKYLRKRARHNAKDGSNGNNSQQSVIQTPPPTTAALSPSGKDRDSTTNGNRKNIGSSVEPTSVAVTGTGPIPTTSKQIGTSETISAASQSTPTTGTTTAAAATSVAPSTQQTLSNSQLLKEQQLILQQLQAKTTHHGTNVETSAAVFMKTMLDTLLTTFLDTTIAQAKRQAGKVEPPPTTKSSVPGTQSTTSKSNSNSKGKAKKLLIQPRHIQDAVQYTHSLRELVLGNAKTSSLVQSPQLPTAETTARSTTSAATTVNAHQPLGENCIAEKNSTGTVVENEKRKATVTAPATNTRTTTITPESGTATTAALPSNLRSVGSCKAPSLGSLTGQAVIFEGCSSDLFDHFLRQVKNSTPNASLFVWHDCSLNEHLQQMGMQHGRELLFGAFLEALSRSTMYALPTRARDIRRVTLVKHGPLHCMALGLAAFRSGLLSTVQLDVLRTYFRRQWDAQLVTPSTYKTQPQVDNHRSMTAAESTTKASAVTTTETQPPSQSPTTPSEQSRIPTGPQVLITYIHLV